jgi:hypothetical protein
VRLETSGKLFLEYRTDGWEGTIEVRSKGFVIESDTGSTWRTLTIDVTLSQPQDVEFVIRPERGTLYLGPIRFTSDPAGSAEARLQVQRLLDQFEDESPAVRWHAVDLLLQQGAAIHDEVKRRREQSRDPEVRALCEFVLQQFDRTRLDLRLTAGADGLDQFNHSGQLIRR